MRQITKITAALALIISMASCQSSKSGCYDFGEVHSQKIETKDSNYSNSYTNMKVVCKP